MTQNDSLVRALRDLRSVSNPGADQKARVLAAVRTGAVPRAASPVDPMRRDEQHEPRALPATGAGKNLWLPGVLLGLALFGAGYGLGRNASGHGAGSGESSSASASPPPHLELSVAAPSSGVEPSLEQEPKAFEAAPSSSEPSLRADSRARRPRRLASDSPRSKSPRATLSLAEALRLLHRADRAIYSDQAPWALGLLDELDERAPRSMLREERIATRVLALCKDGETEHAVSLAREAQAEDPSSIYGALLERGCNPK
jgi:hypothetical protein